MSFAPTPDKRKWRHYVEATLFLLANIVFIWYWVGFPLNNSYYLNGYPRFGTPPSPNNYLSSRYSYEWWCQWLVGLNIILPFLFSDALLYNNLREFADLHYHCSRFAQFYNLVVFIMLSINWLLFCNSGSFPNFTMCSSPVWCCVYFASSFQDSMWCPNVTPCVPNVTSLSVTSAFFQTWLFSLLFILWSFLHEGINSRFTTYSVFRSK